MHIQDKGTGMPIAGKDGRLRIQARHDEFLPHHNLDFKQGVGDMDPGDGGIEGDSHGGMDVQLAIIRTPQDQKKRDDGNKYFRLSLSSITILGL